MAAIPNATKAATEKDAIAGNQRGGSSSPIKHIDTMNRLDYYEILPKGLDAYLSHYGWHFSKSLCEMAVSKMKDRNGSKVPFLEREKAKSWLEQYGVKLENDKGYDISYVWAMGRADLLGSSVSDDAHLAKFVKDYLDDPDGYDGIAFSRFLADCSAKGEPIIWEDMI